MPSSGMNPLTGLSRQAATQRLKDEGPNEVPTRGEMRFLTFLIDALREPMFLLLVACGAIYWAVGDAQEAAMLLGFVFFVLGITLYQERKTQRALRALKDLSSPRAIVIRDGLRLNIAGREVAREDLILLSEGNRVAADAVVKESSNLFVDESLLTGESLPLRKTTGDRVFAGTSVVKGHGAAHVFATGRQSQLGKLGKAIESGGPGSTPLQEEARTVVQVLAGVGALLCIAVVVLYGRLRGDWVGGLLAGLSLAMAILPNELPAILTAFLALGAWRVPANRVLTRRLPALEALGSASVLCVDKTGTLTLNQLVLRQLFASDRFWSTETTELPETFHALLEYAVLASQKDPFDPLEQAIKKLGQEKLTGTEHIHTGWTLVREYPLSDDLLALSHVWRSTDGRDYIIAAKGAPEAVLDLCHLPESQRQEISQTVEKMAKGGLRVIATARATFSPSPLPADQHRFDFGFLGLLGFEDPIRPSAPAAVQRCQEAGIRILMVTGDHPETARSIARQLGLRNQELLLGKEIESMNEPHLRQTLDRIGILSRCLPEHKLRVVKALRQSGEVVAMTGDGVNDAPALHQATIGIAMGNRGTDVAREAASLVLLDDDFGSIVEAIGVGRRISNNLRNALAYVLAVHVPIAGLSLLPIVFGLPLVLLPAHIAFLHLIIEPACSIVFEAEPASPGIWRSPAHRAGSRLFSRRIVALSALQGLTSLIVLLGLFAIALTWGRTEAQARGIALTGLIAANLALIFANLTWDRSLLDVLRARNPALWWVTGGAILLLAAILGISSLRELFRIGPLGPADLALCLGAGVASVLVFRGGVPLLQRFPSWRHSRAGK